MNHYELKPWANHQHLNCSSFHCKMVTKTIPDGSMVKSTYCSYRGPKFSVPHPSQVAQKSMEIHHLWTLRHLNIHIHKTVRQIDTHTYTQLKILTTTTAKWSQDYRVDHNHETWPMMHCKSFGVLFPLLWCGEGIVGTLQPHTLILMKPNRQTKRETQGEVSKFLTRVAKGNCYPCQRHLLWPMGQCQASPQGKGR